MPKIAEGVFAPRPTKDHHERDAVGKERSRKDACAAAFPGRVAVLCTRPWRHKGPHVAGLLNQRVCARWLDERGEVAP